MIWLKDKIDSWIYVTAVNDVNNLKSEMLSLSEGRFCAFSKAVSQIVTVADFESMA